MNGWIWLAALAAIVFLALLTVAFAGADTIR